MQRSTRSIPDGYHTITPTLVLGNAQKALDFYRKAFGAEVVSTRPTRKTCRSRKSSGAVTSS